MKLKDAMEGYRRRTGQRLTYRKLAESTGISESTLRTTGSRLGYHPTLANIEKLCSALNVTPGDLLEIIKDPPKPKRKPKKTRPRGKGRK